jgi:hypothetical protein
MTLVPNRDQLEIFVQALFRYCGTEGFVALRAFYEGQDKRFRTPSIGLAGGLSSLIEAAEDYANRAANDPKPVVFCPPIVVFINKDRAREQDILLAPALSVELDQAPQEARGNLERTLCQATMVVRSGGVWINPATGQAEDKLHIHWRLAKPARGADIAKLKQVRRLATTFVGGDATNIPACHPIRWPGSWHRKIDPARLCEIIALDPDREIELDTALKILETLAPPEQKKTKTNGRGQAGDWDTLVDQILRGELLHESLTKLAMKMLVSGMDDGAAVNSLRAILRQSKAPRDSRFDQRYDYIPRAVSSAREKIDAEKTPPPGPAPSPRALTEVHKVFQEWLGKKYDTMVLDAVLATAAAEQLPGDPAWLMIISGPGNAKTETAQSVSTISGAHIVSTITSEGALLSATPKKGRSRGATGGLLRAIGNRGILVIKDFTSILSMERNVRSALMAALREIHDGRWVRNVGTDGGQTLSWIGRIVVVAACTTAWDQAHAVIATMGDRFVLIRSDSHKGRTEAGTKAIRNTGDETRMRQEMATAVAGLLVNLKIAEAKLTDDEVQRILDVADIVTLARTGVETDYKGDVIDAHAPEMPTRFAKQLVQIMRGALALDMTRWEALGLVVRCARDSIPQLRLAVLDDLKEYGASEAGEIRKRLQKPRRTISRILEALHALGLVICTETRKTKASGAEVTIRKYSLTTDTANALAALNP